MKISKITILNFRSVKQVEIKADDFNILVGQNNHGKTNFFEAIDWFFNGTKKSESIDNIRFGRTGVAEVSVEIEFNGAQDGANRMKNDTNKTKIMKLLNGNDIVVVKRSSKDPKKRSVSVNGNWIDKVPTGFDNALNDFMPHFEYVDTRKYFEDVAKYSKSTPIGIMLSGVLTTILEGSKEYQKFRQQFEKIFGDDKSDVKVELDQLSNQVKIYLEKQFPDCTKVSFEITPPIFDDLLKNFDTTIDDGIETSAAEKGDGMQRALMLAILQAYAKFRKSNEEVGKSFLFFIDEAELHLHPSAQRKLKNVLIELSANEDQVFINTHSSVLVVDEHDHQKIFKVEKVNKETNVTSILDTQKQYIIYELLGGSPADLLLPRNFLIVEGKSDYIFFAEIIKQFYTDKPLIQIVYAEGNLDKQQKTMYAINAVYVPLGVSSPVYKKRLIILCDKPSSKSKENDRNGFLTANNHLTVNEQYIELPVNAIEKYYPQPWQKSDDQIKKMDKTINAKVDLAKEVAANINREQFEKEMPVAFNALIKCWDLAY